ncbi:type III toxin-antitoxin system ToxN/AbiQ family toxin [Mediterraneibacter agrestimuris]|nr:type III toxin-antitoxin system ToxN/AbiQ family toxin [Mediterraneibacter agrestimuris]
MNWYVVGKKYINYLTQFDSRVGYNEKEKRTMSTCSRKKKP